MVIKGPARECDQRGLQEMVIRGALKRKGDQRRVIKGIVFQGTFSQRILKDSVKHVRESNPYEIWFLKYHAQIISFLNNKLVANKHPQLPQTRAINCKGQFFNGHLINRGGIFNVTMSRFNPNSVL